MAKRERKKITRRHERVAQALTVSENLSAQEKAKFALGYRAGETGALIATPEVARAVKAGLVRRLVAEAAPRSMGLLMRVVEAGHKTMDAGDSATALQIDAAKSLLGLSGLQAIAEEKDYGDMTDLEFRQVLERIQGELAKRSAVDAAGTVSAPNDAPGDSQAADNVESLFS